MSIQRYRGRLLDDSELPDLVGATASITRIGPEIDVDINLSNDAFKDDLDGIMATLGLTFVSTSPTTPPIQIADCWQAPVLDKDLTTPPGAPTDGDTYIVGSPAAGGWVGRDYEIAQWDATNAMWLYAVPSDGFVAWVDDESIHYVYTTADDWTRYAPGAPISEAVTTENITGTDTALADLLDNNPVVSSVIIILNGIVQTRGAGNDYTLGGAGNRTITWLASTGTAVDMVTTDRMLVYYVRL